MAHLDENGTPAGDGRPDDANGTPPAADGPSRLQELERENARLRTELAEVRQKYEVHRELYAAVSDDDFPYTEEELFRLAEAGPTLSELIADLEREFGAGQNP